VNRSLALVYIASFGALTSFYLMLGVTPLYAVENGHGPLGGAITTAVFMLATVAAELVATRIMRRIGTQRTLALGLALMTVPVFALLFTTSLPWVLVISAVRGAGFALVVIAGSTMVADLAPEGKRGEGIGLYGVIVGVPSVFALPFGVWLAEQIGFAPLFILAGSVAVFAVVTAVVRIPLPAAQELTGMIHSLRTPGVLPLAIVFCVSALASGLLVTYVPLGFGASVAALALLASGLASTLTRWLAGRFGDRRDARLLLVPALAIAVVGLAVVLFAPPLVIVGSLLFGVSFGVLQNATIHLMFEATGASGFGAVSAIWNIAFDAGLGLGALSFGVLSAGYSLGVAATLLLAAIAFMAFWMRSGSSYSSQVTAG
jgi:predicted MFS family arabinose efflux permease